MRSDTYFFGTAQLLERVLSFFMLPVLINGVSKVEYAIWTQSIVTSGLMITVISLGFSTTIVKFLPPFEDDPKKSYSLLKAMSLSIMTWAILISLLIHIFALDISSVVFGSSKYQGFIPVLILLIISEAIFDFIISLLRARRRIRTASVYVFLKGIWRLSVIIISIYIFDSGFFAGFLFFVILQFIIVVCMSLYYLPARVLIVSSHDLNKENWFEVIKFSLPLVVIAALTFFNNFTDRYFITYFIGLEKLASYAAVYSLAAIGSIFYSTLGFTLFPELSRKWEVTSKHQKGELIGEAFIFYLFFQMPFIFGLAIVGPYLMTVLSGSLINAPLFLYILLGANIALFGIYQIFWYAVLLGSGSISGFKILSIASVLNIVCNFLMVPVIGILGAAISGSLSNSILVLLSLYMAQKSIVFQLPYKSLKDILIRSFFLGAFLYLCSVYLNLTKLSILVPFIIFSILAYGLFDLFGAKRSILKGIV
jgi:O-antigen/teichoic acid export membrane protein